MAPATNGELLLGFQRPQNKLVDQVIRTPGRIPSPQPTHLGLPGSGANSPRILQETGSGYVAPKFEGKEQQMEEGELLSAMIRTWMPNGFTDRLL